MSPILFGLVMEYVRRLLPPSNRPVIRFYMAPGSPAIRVEVDFADDQIRVCDSVADMRSLITTLRLVLLAVGLEWNPTKVLLTAYWTP